MIPSLRDTALFLDVDGTLLEIQDQPDAVVSNSALTELLLKLSEGAGGALAMISGRPIDEIDRIFRPQIFCAAGGHGAQIRLPDGRIEIDRAPFPKLTLARLQKALEAYEGTFVEPKSHGLALHYRANPPAADAVRGLAEEALAELTRKGEHFELLSGKMVFELVPRDVNKGAAIKRLMQESAFAGRTPVFIGDDVTDEFGFRAVNALGGRSLRVGEQDAPSAAPERLEDVAAVHRWLKDILEKGK